MRVFVAGASGVIGRQLVPILAAAGHDVIGLARSTSSGVIIDGMGATVAMADALDRAATMRAVADAAPDAVVNMLTSIPADIKPRRLARDFRVTNRLRTEGTRNLAEAAEHARAKHFISEGLAYAYEPGGEGPATEDEPFWQKPPKQFAPALAAVQDLEALTEDAGGLVLRLGHLYGPGTTFGADGSFVRQLRAGKVPIVGDGTATFSFTHTEDAASAIVAALDTRVVGALNVVDDEPALVSAWLPVLADVLSAREPRHVPVALARMAVGSWGVAFMTQLRGADNSRARLALDWRPHFTSWHQGFVAELGDVAAASER